MPRVPGRSTRAAARTAGAFGLNTPPDTGGMDEAIAAAAAVRVERTYTTPVENHHTIEPSATVAEWDGATLTLHEATQGVVSTRNDVARHRAGERISTGFVESAINQVVSKRFGKRQSMRWTRRGAQPALQARTRVLDGELEDAFRRRWPGFRPPPRGQEVGNGPLASLVPPAITAPAAPIL